MARNRSSFGRIFKRPGRAGFYLRATYKGRTFERYAGPDRRTATEYAAALLRQLSREHLLGEKVVAAVTFTEFGPILLASLQARHAATTLEGDKGRLERVKRHFGTIPLRDIGPAEVQDFLAALRNSEKLTIAATNRYAAFLSVAFKLAVAKGFARSNPLKEVSRPREPQRAVPFLSAADVDRIVAEARDPRFGALLRILADSGLRRSEAIRLEWRDVDVRRRCLVVRESKTRRPREVPLTDAAVVTFRGMEAQRPATPIKGPDLLWPEFAGKRLQAVSSRFSTIAKRLGREGLRLHDLRHGFCSRLAQAGVALPTIGALAGHTCWATTARYASHLPEGAAGAAIAAMQRNERPEPAAERAAGG